MDVRTGTCRVVFVDDEQNVLDGLRRSLRCMRKSWEMHFCSSGPEALELLATESIDVIVTDMRMPDMDGAQLLAEVKDRWPQMLRFVLSGYAEVEAALRTVPVAHQFLSKPCDPQRLKELIQRTSSLYSLLENQRVRSSLGRIKNLPAVPKIYNELNLALTNPETSMEDVAAIISRDIGIATRVLQMVNSSYFGSNHPITSIQQATAFLGVQMIKNLVLTLEVYGSSAVPGGEGRYSHDVQQRHAEDVARVAVKICGDRSLADSVYMAGIVHDIGRLVIANCMPELLDELIAAEQRAGDQACSSVVEREVVGASHAEIGAYLLGSWGLPMVIVEAVAYHHLPSVLGSTELGVVGAVHLAEYLVNRINAEESPDGASSAHDLDLAMLAELESPPDMEQLELQARELLGELSSSEAES